MLARYVQGRAQALVCVETWEGKNKRRAISLQFHYICFITFIYISLSLRCLLHALFPVVYLCYKQENVNLENIFLFLSQEAPTISFPIWRYVFIFVTLFSFPKGMEEANMRARAIPKAGGVS